MMVYGYLKFSLSITVISFLVGMIVNAFLKKTTFYKHHLSHLNFIKNDLLNTWMGVGIVKWIIIKSPLRYLNQNIKITARPSRTDLLNLRAHMTSAEIDHLIGFVFVMLFVIHAMYMHKFILAIVMLFINIIFNLYPSLIQQQNKRRIDGVLRRL